LKRSREHGAHARNLAPSRSHGTPEASRNRRLGGAEIPTTPSGLCLVGRVLTFGDARYYGDTLGLRLNGPILGSVATPTGLGYYMVASDGGVFTFGDATFHGSTGSMRLNQPVRGLVPTADNAGYWLIAADGGVFSFGTAVFHGSIPGVLAPGSRLNKPVIGGVRYGDGYLMVASDGGIFDFSSQPFLGSLGGNPPANPIVAVAPLG